jgi:glycosyltransferase involved in cell wall biosynthesis
VAALRVLGETAYPLTVASARVRIASFAPFLLSHGVELRYLPTLTEREYGLLVSTAPAPRKAIVLAAAAARAALRRERVEARSLVHRLRLPSPVPGVDPPRRLDFYDLDDALFLGSASPANRRFAWAKQEARRCVAYLRRARQVIAGNSFLAERSREHARNVEVVPTCVDPTAQPLRAHADADVVTVGWIGSHTTSDYLAPVLPAFEHLNSGGLRARLVLVGADTRLSAPWIEHRRWSLASERDDLASFDIGIMPLPDTEWVRGKCGYKLLQYFAAGVPAIASPVGVNPALIGADRGFLPTSVEDWQAALGRLISDVDERRERGAAAREFVEREFSYQRWAPELASLIRSVST